MPDEPGHLAPWQNIYGAPDRPPQFRSWRLLRWISGLFCEPTGKFAAYTLATMGLSLMWHVLLLIRLLPVCPRNITKAVANDVTFSIVHPTSFSIGVGLFAIAFKPQIAFWGSKTVNAALGAVWVGFVVFTIMLVMKDSTSWPRSSYQTEDPCKTYALEDIVRTRHATMTTEQCDNPPEDYKESKEQYLSLVDPKNTSIWGQYNTFLTEFVGICVVSVFWYGLSACGWVVVNKRQLAARSSRGTEKEAVKAALRDFTEERKRTAKNLTIIYFLLCTWFPFRIYASWYQHDFLCDSWIMGYDAFFWIVGIAIVFAIFLAFLHGIDELKSILPFLGIGLVLNILQAYQWTGSHFLAIVSGANTFLTSLGPVPVAPVLVASCLLGLECWIVHDLLCKELATLWSWISTIFRVKAQ